MTAEEEVFEVIYESFSNGHGLSLMAPNADDMKELAVRIVARLRDTVGLK